MVKLAGLPNERASLTMPLVVAAVYAVAAGIYVIVSGRMAMSGAASVAELHGIETTKDLALVLVTALVVFFGTWFGGRRSQRDIRLTGQRERARVAQQSNMLAGALAARPEIQRLQQHHRPALALVGRRHGDVEQVGLVHALHRHKVAQHRLAAQQHLRLVAGVQGVAEIGAAPGVGVGRLLDREHGFEPLAGERFQAGFDGQRGGHHRGGVPAGESVGGVGSAAALSRSRSSVVRATLSRM